MHIYEVDMHFSESLSSMVSLVNTSGRNITPFNPLYSKNLRCTWLITAPQHQIIRFWFSKFALAKPGDYLMIKEMLLKNFTTKPGLDKRWASSDKYLWIRFKSDENDVTAGFNLTWGFVNKPKASGPKYSTLQPSPKMSTSPETSTSNSQEDPKVSPSTVIGVGLVLVFLWLFSCLCCSCLSKEENK